MLSCAAWHLQMHQGVAYCHPIRASVRTASLGTYATRISPKQLKSMELGPIEAVVGSTVAIGACGACQVHQGVGNCHPVPASVRTCLLGTYATRISSEHLKTNRRLSEVDANMIREDGNEQIFAAGSKRMRMEPARLTDQARYKELRGKD
jgi:hypothetical protein